MDLNPRDYVRDFYSAGNKALLKRRVVANGLPLPPSDNMLAAGMNDARWFYATPYHQGTTAMLDPDFGRHADPNVRRGKLDELNAHCVRILTENMGDAKMSEQYWEYLLSTQKGDRLIHQPQYTNYHRTIGGSARFLPQ